MQNKSSGSGTMLLSVLMSLPGPLILGIGLLSGQSSTQLADFFRRSAELLALICAFVVYRITQSMKDSDGLRKARLERRSNFFVGTVMCISGIIMIFLALFAGSEDKGNVVPGLVIALLGLVANTLFWRKYTRLNRQNPNAIIAVQGRLYRVKAMVDACVTVALAAVFLFPASPVSGRLDTIGSIAVAVYLIWCGIETVCESLSQNP